MKKFFKKIIDAIVILLTGMSDKAVDSGICDYSGEGRNSYGN